MSPEATKTTVLDEEKEQAKTEKKTRKAPKALGLPPTITVQHLAELTNLTPIEIIKQLMRNGIMASINQVIDYEVATLVAGAFGIRTKQAQTAGSATGSGKVDETVNPSRLVERPPVVTILGHVDHGKTTLLDTIRKSGVAAGEIGGITQHIGAYQVTYNGKEITFLDTPGHEAFTAIRARGARATDIAVLVVAADDGVMPQTIEALDHAKAAGVPILVAINKVDRPEADVERVKRQLGEQDLILEEWGGDVITAEVSAKQGTGIENILESVLVVSEVAELKADPDTDATGVVIEAKLDRNRGALATVLVQNGTLRVGDYIVAGGAWGRTKAMSNDLGKRIKEAPPSLPVEVMGFNSLPEAGDVFRVVSTEKAAREKSGGVSQQRELESATARALTLEEINARITAGDVKELSLILKADVQGSVEAVRSSLERLDDEMAKIRILHSGSGSITEGDVLLASASKAIVIGFSTTEQLGVDRLAEREGVEIRHYNVIYKLIEDLDKALKGILEPTTKDVVQGHAEVRVVFATSKRIKIAGCMVTDGRLARGALVKVLRNGEVVHEGSISSLKHFKEDVNEMTAGFECGVGVSSFIDFEEGDVLETYRREKSGS